MKSALHCHGKLKLTNVENGRRRRPKEEEEVFSQLLASFQVLQKVDIVFGCLKIWFSLRFKSKQTKSST